MDDFFARLQERTDNGTKLPTWCVCLLTQAAAALTRFSAASQAWRALL